MDWCNHITVDPQICHGQACVKDTRVMVSVVLDNLAGGCTVDEILAGYPSLSREGIPSRNRICGGTGPRAGSAAIRVTRADAPQNRRKPSDCGGNFVWGTETAFPELGCRILQQPLGPNPHVDN